MTAAQQAGTAIIPNSVETDEKPQPIEWVAEYSYGTSPFFIHKSPHPILCHPTLGPINVMPDLIEALNDYAEAYEAAYGRRESVPDLIPFMLSGFLASDRSFSRARKK